MGDEDLPEALPRAFLFRERVLELLVRDQSTLDEDGADQAGGDCGRGLHGLSIGNPSFEG